MKNYFADYVTRLIDSGKKVSHEKISEALDRLLQDETRRERLKVPSDVNWKYVEWCYPPIIQSGGKYDLRPSASSNEQNLHAGTVVCAFGTRYKSYCSNVARTILINPEKVHYVIKKTKEDNYSFLVELQSYLFTLLVSGAACNEIYNKVVSYIRQKKPELVTHFVKNCGFGVLNQIILDWS
jgi:nucleosome binding factor SPN SPT16 subunit